MTVQEWETVLVLIDRGVNTAPAIAQALGWEKSNKYNRKNQVYNILKKLEKWGRVERAGMDGQSIIWRRKERLDKSGTHQCIGCLFVITEDD